MVLSVSVMARAGDLDADNAPGPHDMDGTAPSQRAPRVYATQNYGLTFRVPPHAFYCPLPKDWSGSDHGTVIFLEPPGSCSGGGLASSSRRFERDVSRIEIYYGHDLSDDAPSEPRACDRVAQVRFLGSDTPVCRSMDNGAITLRARGKYRSDAPAEADFALVTTAARLAHDFTVFRELLASAKACRTKGMKQQGRSDRGAPDVACPTEGRWF